MFNKKHKRFIPQAGERGVGGGNVIGGVAAVIFFFGCNLV
ncbi:hypothetical protein KNP414_05452 [Paenibacillus mucilaginosus KNP414]|uniref:Uncharacterized protein n=1 Tax=Paenibacillus mucilaginosus (strain KNP414) TaxID=1036673 RepID=F8FI73_PAEMK|nr:hypothetical protein KNP414_05452 [Paenibacillus mucilaginosus KNP414]